MQIREISTRALAKLQGKIRYYTGRPCRNSHDAERYTCSGACVECLKPSTRRVRGLASVRAVRLYVNIPIGTTDDGVLQFSYWIQHSCVPAFFKPTD
jgi:hypothetical protein